MDDKQINFTPAEAFLLALIGYMILLFIMAWPAELLWNSVVPDVFPGMDTIEYLDMVRLLILVRIILPSGTSFNKETKDA